MGQILDRLKGKQWRQDQIDKISDKVFDTVKNERGKATLTFEDLYIVVLLVFNDLNKRLPGPHFDPPTKDKVKAMMQTYFKRLSSPALGHVPVLDTSCCVWDCDMNLDGELDREEFGKFITKLTAETCIVVSQGLIITLAVAPLLAILTKKSTEGFPHVGKVVQKIPTSVYASLVTVAFMMFQNSISKVE